MPYPANPKIDRDVWNRTARYTKAINLGMRIYRGGIRF